MSLVSPEGPLASTLDDTIKRKAMEGETRSTAASFCRQRADGSSA